MVTRLYNGMRRVDPAGKAKGPSESISQEQFMVSMSHLLKGNSEEKSLMILNMSSVTEGPVKARDVQKVERPCGPSRPSQAVSVSLGGGLWMTEQLVGTSWRCLPFGNPRPHNWLRSELWIKAWAKLDQPRVSLEK